MADSTTSMERIYKIFISFTFSDLPERKAAIEAVIDRMHIPIALENFSPAAWVLMSLRRITRRLFRRL